MKKWLVRIAIFVLLLVLISSCSDNSSSTKYEYDSSDKYYRTNDYNNDGKLTQKEFQDAVGDYLDDHGY